MQDTTFCELRHKEVVNIVDGRRLGNICDVVFERYTGKVLGFIVPGFRRFFGFKACEDIFIAHLSICKIGEDVILVELFCKDDEPVCKNPPPPKKEPHKEGHKGIVNYK